MTMEQQVIFWMGRRGIDKVKLAKLMKSNVPNMVRDLSYKQLSRANVKRLKRLAGVLGVEYVGLMVEKEKVESVFKAAGY